MDVHVVVDHHAEGGQPSLGIPEEVSRSQWLDGVTLYSAGDDTQSIKVLPNETGFETIRLYKRPLVE
jgi:hypothetical protein